MTDYLILRKTTGIVNDQAVLPHTWVLDNVIVKASSARRALTAAGVKEGEYVAVPARNWKPLTVKVEQTTKITIG